ncbi:hypothetical protein KCM76_20600 [Zooshikella marina]|uniref:DUF6962 family protein n=1 Tax=Zooshikella ganghwensis TaxID=202772 RepID=UPI001BAFDE4A|nr:hypothetical protein [Zooshikella ganghwensis]MBU2708405.1 hypothetical protein [Zooshikella ganghwensis]
MTSLAVSDAILCFSCSYSVFLLLQQKTFSNDQKLPATAALIGFILMSLASFFGTLYYGFSPIWADIHRLFTHAATFLALPLIAGAYAHLAWPLNWHKPMWGRLIIALMICFEIARRFQAIETTYTAIGIMSLLVILLVGFKFIRQKPSFFIYILVGSASFSVAGLVIGTHGYLAGFLRLDLFHYLLALGSLSLGTGYFLFVRKPQGSPQLSL